MKKNKSPKSRKSPKYILPRIFEITRDTTIPNSIIQKNKIHKFIEKYDKLKEKNKENIYDLKCDLEFNNSKHIKSQVIKKINDCKAIKYNCNSDKIEPMYTREYPCKNVDELIAQLEYMLSILSIKDNYFSIKDSGIKRKYKSKKLKKQSLRN
jgi:hypothetical protein